MNDFSKNVTIPYDLFFNFVKYFYAIDDDPELYAAIDKGLQAKMEAMIKRELYSTYKDSSLSVEQREQARQQYLDKVGIPKSFRWDKNHVNNNYKPQED